MKKITDLIRLQSGQPTAFVKTKNGHTVTLDNLGGYSYTSENESVRIRKAVEGKTTFSVTGQPEITDYLNIPISETILASESAVKEAFELKKSLFNK